MRKLGKKQLTHRAQDAARRDPSCADPLRAGARRGRPRSSITYDTHAERTGITALLRISLKPRHPPPRPRDAAELARGHLRQPGERAAMNLHAIKAIYLFEMARPSARCCRASSRRSSRPRSISSSSAPPSARASRKIDGVAYGAFIVPGLIMLSLLTQSISNASFGIYFPRFTGTIYELLSAPVSFSRSSSAYVGAAATKSVILGLIILARRRCSCRSGSSIPCGCCCSWC
jgi:hypothetical protein